jgi:polyisoprenoid-binding protein YceI
MQLRRGALAFLLAVVPFGSLRAADTFKVDPIHSGILFRVKHFDAGYVWGRFNDFSGTFTIDKDNPTASSFEIEVKVESIDSNNKGRDKHLRSPDFFSASEFPTISFKSRDVKKLDEHTYEVSGDLTMHGKTQPVTMKVEHVGVAKDPRGNVHSGLEATFTVKRGDFGMKSMRGIGEEVRIIAAIEGVYREGAARQ